MNDRNSDRIYTDWNVNREIELWKLIFSHLYISLYKEYGLYNKKYFLKKETDKTLKNLNNKVRVNVVKTFFCNTHKWILYTNLK